MKVKRAMGIFLAAMLAVSSIPGTVQAANQSHMIPYTANYDSSAWPQKQMNAVFTSDEIIVDGIADEAYENAESSRIENVIPVGGYEYPDGEQSYGILRLLWDGPVLYLLVEVYDVTPHRGTGAEKSGPTGNPAVPKTLDSVTFGIDLYNDKVLYETDTIGTFTIGSDGELYYYRNANIPSLGTPMADPIHPEYQNRIKEYAVADLQDETGGGNGLYGGAGDPAGRPCASEWDTDWSGS